MSSLKMPGCDREMRIRNDSSTFWSKAEEHGRPLHPCEVGLVVAVGPARPTRQVSLAVALYDGLGGRQIVGMAALGFDEMALHRLAVVLGVPLLRITVRLGDGESKRSPKTMQERLDDLGETATRLRLPLGQPA